MFILKIRIAVTMKTVALWDVTRGTPVEIYRRFGNPHCLDHQSEGVTVRRGVTVGHRTDVHITFVSGMTSGMRS